MTIARLAGFSLTSADPVRLAGFYHTAFGFAVGAARSEVAHAYGVDGRATIVPLKLGAQSIELVGFERAGAPYPADSTSHDGWFQHLALVVSDMAAAFGRLSDQPGWHSITRGGQPVRLPDNAGGVTAFKFRDPDGHPLELLAFPDGKVPSAWSGRTGGPVLGIDHSAIAVADTARARAFYEAHGLSVAAISLNQGPAQQALDDADDVTVQVVGLAPPAAPPHLELLGYRSPTVRPGIAGPADIACTRTLAVPADRAAIGRMLSDPDGHRMLLVAG